MNEVELHFLSRQQSEAQASKVKTTDAISLWEGLRGRSFEPQYLSWHLLALTLFPTKVLENSLLQTTKNKAQYFEKTIQ